MDYGPNDCRMIKSNFEMYSISMCTIFHIAIENCPQTLKPKLGTIQSTIKMLETNPIEFYFIFFYITFGHEQVDVVSGDGSTMDFIAHYGAIVLNNISFTSF